MNCGQRCGVAGEFFYEIVNEETGEVESRSDTKRNLILNQAFTLLAAYSYVENVAYCAIGNGTSPPLQTDTGLAAEVTRTSTLDTSYSPYALSSLSYTYDNASTSFGVTKGPATVTHTRVFKFSSLDPYTTFGELGWSYSSVAGNNLFSKTTFPSPITVPRGRYLRISYALTISMGSTQSVYNANYGNAGYIYPPQIENGFSQSYHVWGNGFGFYNVGLKRLNSDGTLGYFDGALDSNEPYSTATLFMSNDAYVPGSGSRASTVYNLASGATLTTGAAPLGQGLLYTKSATLQRGQTGYLGCFGYGPTGGVGATGAAIANPGFSFIALTGLNQRDTWGTTLVGSTFSYPVSYDGTTITGYSFAKDTSHTLTFSVEINVYRV